ncbi:MAG: Uma2 family endonuclease [Armatimonadetes bacterium]|nr:Uma2 family endonuclease [Anaerolineae bacterium]
METTNEQIGMPLDELLQRGSRENFELINGKVKIAMPTGGLHNDLLYLLFVKIYAYIMQQQSGAVRFEFTFIQPDSYNPNWVKASYTPDVCVYNGTRLADYIAATPDRGTRPYELIPDITIEVLSPNDYYSDVDEKVEAYLRLGVRHVVLVDAQRRKVIHHLPGAAPVSMAADAPDAALTFGDLLPGFALPLADLFA